MSVIGASPHLGSLTCFNVDQLFRVKLPTITSLLPQKWWLQSTPHSHCITGRLCRDDIAVCGPHCTTTIEFQFRSDLYLHCIITEIQSKHSGPASNARKSILQNGSGRIVDSAVHPCFQKQRTDYEFTMN